MKHVLIICILLSYLLQSCSVGTSGTWKNENIDNYLKRDIESLDTKVLEAITKNKPTILKELLSEKLKEKKDIDVDTLIQQASTFITNSDFEILDQYYVKNTNTGIGNTVMSGISGQNDYIIHYQALNEEMFISLLLLENGVLITNIYGKYNDGWKLNIFQIGQYSINGLIAPELYEKSINEYEKGYLVDATISIFLAKLVAHPAGEFWKYQINDEMKDFNDKIFKEIPNKYQLPFEITNIDSKPIIINVYPINSHEGYFPMIEYVTELDLNDTNLTRFENDKIHKSIGEIFEGIDKNNKYLYYRAYSEMPDGKTLIPYYGFVNEIKPVANIK